MALASNKSSLELCAVVGVVVCRRRLLVEVEVHDASTRDVVETRQGDDTHLRLRKCMNGEVALLSASMLIAR